MNRHWLLSVAVSVLLVSCSNNPTGLQNEQGIEVSCVDDKYQTALQQQMSGLNSMKSEAERARMIAKEQEDKQILQWLQGTWEWSGRIHLYGYQYADVSMRLVITGDNVTAYGNGKIQDQGRIKDIDITNERIHFGEYSYLDFDKDRKIIYTGKREEKTCYKKISDNTYHSSNSSVAYSSSGSSNGHSYVTTFHTSAEVLSYTGGKFRDRSGNVISIRQEGIYANGGYPRGQLITNAVKVVRFDATSALLTTSSPYGGGGAMYIRVDASQGTITDGSGCVYYKQ